MGFMVCFGFIWFLWFVFGFFLPCGHVKINGPSEMSQWVKSPATKHDNLSGIPRTHTVKDRSESYQLSSDLHTRHSPCP